MKLIAFLVSLALFSAGIYMTAAAFSFVGLETVFFIGGIVVASVGIMIPVHVLKRVDG